MKIDWKRNLLISWIGCFFTGASFSLVMPFIPLYIEELGAPKSQIELFSGLAISVTAFAAAIIAPVWGNLADQKGRRLMMIRAAAGMTVTMGSLAFVPNVYWLLIMRFFTGILSGYIPNATALIASQAPKEKERLGTRNLSNRSYRRKLDRAFYGWCFSTVVWYEECIYHHRGRSFDHIAANDLFGSRRFRTC